MVTESVFGLFQFIAFRLVSMFLLGCVATTIVQAQDASNSHHRYFGFEANFGAKATRISSDLTAIHDMDVLDEGGSLGFVMGNQVVKTRLQAAGFYYSSSSVEHTVNIVTSGILLNVYPLKLINKTRQALNPYVSGGVDYNIIKFRGCYTNPDSKINYSRSSAPYIGKIASTCGTAGAGLEWRLPQMYDFVHIFAEARYSWTVHRNADEVFKNTTVANPTSINIGVSFGFLR